LVLVDLRPPRPSCSAEWLLCRRRCCSCWRSDDYAIAVLAPGTFLGRVKLRMSESRRLFGSLMPLDASTNNRLRMQAFSSSSCFPCAASRASQTDAKTHSSSTRSSLENVVLGGPIDTASPSLRYAGGSAGLWSLSHRGLRSSCAGDEQRVPAGIYARALLLKQCEAAVRQESHRTTPGWGGGGPAVSESLHCRYARLTRFISCLIYQFSEPLRGKGTGHDHSGIRQGKHHRPGSSSPT
jgi:hypothetical protein